MQIALYLSCVVWESRSKSSSENTNNSMGCVVLLASVWAVRQCSCSCVRGLSRGVYIQNVWTDEISESFRKRFRITEAHVSYFNMIQA